MRASSKTLVDILGQSRRMYVCPPFQRNYKWNNKMREAFLDDIRQNVNPDGSERHFMGTLILKEDGKMPRGGMSKRSPPVERYLIIDGQQRLTTASLLLAAIHERVKLMTSDDQTTMDLRRCLQEDGELKLHHSTATDRAAYKAAFDVNKQAERATEVTKALRFFRTELRDLSIEEVQELATSVLYGTEFAVLELSVEENPCMFFAAANGRGAPLTAAELTKNLLMMKAGEEDLEQAERKYWAPLTQGLDDMQVQDFIRDVTHIHHGWVTPGRVYRVLEEDLLNQGESKFFQNLLAWKTAVAFVEAGAWRSQNELSLMTSFRQLNLIRKFMPNTGTPLWAVPLRLWQEQKLSSTQLATCIRVLENYAIRTYGAYRNFVRDVVPDVGKLFIKGLVGDAAVDAYKQALLGHESYRWRTDEALNDYLVSTQFKRNTDRQWIVAVLLGLEHRKSPEGLCLENPSLEHIAPKAWQTASSWKELPATFEGSQHRLGNFTVLGHEANRDLSRQPFASKRLTYRASILKINQELGAYDGPWDALRIHDRTPELAAAIQQAWSYIPPVNA